MWEQMINELVERALAKCYPGEDARVRALERKALEGDERARKVLSDIASRSEEQ